MELKEIESAIEGVLFAAGEPVGVERLCLALDIDRITADSVCQRLADAYRYERRGIRLVRLDNSYQLCSAPEFADCIRRAFESRPTTSLPHGPMWTRSAAWTAPTPSACFWSVT